MTKELEGLFRDAERLRPSPELWARIAKRAPLSAGPESAPGGTRRSPLAWMGRRAGAVWEEASYLRAAAAVIAAALLGLAAFGFFRRPGGEPVREAAVSSAALSGGAAEVFDPELLDWQATLGDFESEAEVAGEDL